MDSIFVAYTCTYSEGSKIAVFMYVRYVVHVLITQLRMCKRVSMHSHKVGKDHQHSPRALNIAHLIIDTIYDRYGPAMQVDLGNVLQAEVSNATLRECI